jgi:hypothetical protein
MRKKVFQIAICLLAVTGNSFAQQWLGSSTSTGAIYRDGNVGVGTSNPHKKITVTGTEVGDGVWVQSNGAPSIAMLSNMGLGYWNGLTQSGDNMIRWGGSDINQANAGALVIGPWTSAASGLRILPTGNVGVGIINPFKKITIKGTELGDGVWVESNGVPSIAMLSNMGPGYWNGLTQSGDNMIRWGGSDINQADAGALVIGPWTSANAGIRILPSGSVGIGTAFPGSYKLAVEGKIGAREVRVTNANPWPDYVFKPEYELLPLKQVETYIQQNGHLPNVPTEKEIHKDGYDLSKMDATLLKKIEELTLHMIELNKKVEELTKENKRLQVPQNNK